MLSDRRQRVLAALIEEYVARAMPVGSRTLTEHYSLGVSSATVRNELMRLEDEGYITQPHTSAGRIPTDSGYRAFVDYLQDAGLLRDDEDCRAQLADMREQAQEIDELLERTGAALARFTDCMSIVLATRVHSVLIKQISLISLTPFHALIVLVTEDGQVFNRSLDFYSEIDTDTLAQMQATFNRLFCGKSVNEVGSIVRSDAFMAACGPLERYVVQELAACFEESGLLHSHRRGLSALLMKPEFAQSSQILPLLQVLEDETVLLELFEDMMDSDSDPTVRIGTENKSQNLHGVSVVASQFGKDKGTGVVAVIGPTRMDYSKVLQAVRMAARSLDED